MLHFTTHAIWCLGLAFTCGSAASPSLFDGPPRRARKISFDDAKTVVETYFYNPDGEDGDGPDYDNDTTKRHTTSTLGEDLRRQEKEKNERRLRELAYRAAGGGGGCEDGDSDDDASGSGSSSSSSSTSDDEEGAGAGKSSRRAQPRNAAAAARRPAPAVGLGKAVVVGAKSVGGEDPANGETASITRKLESLSLAALPGPLAAGITDAQKGAPTPHANFSHENTTEADGAYRTTRPAAAPDLHLVEEPEAEKETTRILPSSLRKLPLPDRGAASPWQEPRKKRQEGRSSAADARSAGSARSGGAFFRTPTPAARRAPPLGDDEDEENEAPDPEGALLSPQAACASAAAPVEGSGALGSPSAHVLPRNRRRGGSRERRTGAAGAEVIQQAEGTRGSARRARSGSRSRGRGQKEDTALPESCAAANPAPTQQRSSSRGPKPNHEDDIVDSVLAREMQGRLRLDEPQGTPKAPKPASQKRSALKKRDPVSALVLQAPPDPSVDDHSDRRRVRTAFRRFAGQGACVVRAMFGFSPSRDAEREKTRKQKQDQVRRKRGFADEAALREFLKRPLVDDASKLDHMVILALLGYYFFEFLIHSAAAIDCDCALAMREQAKIIFAHQPMYKIKKNDSYEKMCKDQIKPAVLPGDDAEVDQDMDATVVDNRFTRAAAEVDSARRLTSKVGLSKADKEARRRKRKKEQKAGTKEAPGGTGGSGGNQNNNSKRNKNNSRLGTGTCCCRDRRSFMWVPFFWPAFDKTMSREEKLQNGYAISCRTLFVTLAVLGTAHFRAWLLALDSPYHQIRDSLYPTSLFPSTAGTPPPSFPINPGTFIATHGIDPQLPFQGAFTRYNDQWTKSREAHGSGAAAFPEHKLRSGGLSGPTDYQTKTSPTKRLADRLVGGTDTSAGTSSSAEQHFSIDQFEDSVGAPVRQHLPKMLKTFDFSVPLPTPRPRYAIVDRLMQMESVGPKDSQKQQISRLRKKAARMASAKMSTIERRPPPREKSSEARVGGGGKGKANTDKTRNSGVPVSSAQPLVGKDGMPPLLVRADITPDQVGDAMQTLIAMVEDVDQRGTATATRDEAPEVAHRPAGVENVHAGVGAHPPPPILGSHLYNFFQDLGAELADDARTLMKMAEAKMSFGRTTTDESFSSSSQQQSRSAPPTTGSTSPYDEMKASAHKQRLTQHLARSYAYAWHRLDDSADYVSGETTARRAGDWGLLSDYWAQRDFVVHVFEGHAAATKQAALLGINMRMVYYVTDLALGPGGGSGENGYGFDLEKNFQSDEHELPEPFPFVQLAAVGAPGTRQAPWTGLSDPTFALAHARTLLLQGGFAEVLISTVSNTAASKAPRAVREDEEKTATFCPLLRVQWVSADRIVWSEVPDAVAGSLCGVQKSPGGVPAKRAIRAMKVAVLKEMNPAEVIAAVWERGLRDDLLHAKTDDKTEGNGNTATSSPGAGHHHQQRTAPTPTPAPQFLVVPPAAGRGEPPKPEKRDGLGGGEVERVVSMGPLASGARAPKLGSRYEEEAAALVDLYESQAKYSASEHVKNYVPGDDKLLQFAMYANDRVQALAKRSFLGGNFHNSMFPAIERLSGVEFLDEHQEVVEMKTTAKDDVSQEAGRSREAERERETQSEIESSTRLGRTVIDEEDHRQGRLPLMLEATLKPDCGREHDATPGDSLHLSETQAWDAILLENKEDVQNLEMIRRSAAATSKSERSQSTSTSSAPPPQEQEKENKKNRRAARKRMQEALEAKFVLESVVRDEAFVARQLLRYPLLSLTEDQALSALVQVNMEAVGWAQRWDASRVEPGSRAPGAKAARELEDAEMARMASTAKITHEQKQMAEEKQASSRGHRAEEGKDPCSPAGTCTCHSNSSTSTSRQHSAASERWTLMCPAPGVAAGVSLTAYTTSADIERLQRPGAQAQAIEDGGSKQLSGQEPPSSARTAPLADGDDHMQVDDDSRAGRRGSRPPPRPQGKRDKQHQQASARSAPSAAVALRELLDALPFSPQIDVDPQRLSHQVERSHAPTSAPAEQDSGEAGTDKNRQVVVKWPSDYLPPHALGTLLKDPAESPAALFPYSRFPYRIEPGVLVRCRQEIPEYCSERSQDLKFVMQTSQTFRISSHARCLYTDVAKVVEQCENVLREGFFSKDDPEVAQRTQTGGFLFSNKVPVLKAWEYMVARTDAEWNKELRDEKRRNLNAAAAGVGDKDTGADYASTFSLSDDSLAQIETFLVDRMQQLSLNERTRSKQGGAGQTIEDEEPAQSSIFSTSSRNTESSASASREEISSRSKKKAGVDGISSGSCRKFKHPFGDESSSLFRVRDLVLGGPETNTAGRPSARGQKDQPTLDELAPGRGNLFARQFVDNLILPHLKTKEEKDAQKVTLRNRALLDRERGQWARLFMYFGREFVADLMETVEPFLSSCVDQRVFRILFLEVLEVLSRTSPSTPRLQKGPKPAEASVELSPHRAALVNVRVFETNAIGRRSHQLHDTEDAPAASSTKLSPEGLQPTSASEKEKRTTRDDEISISRAAEAKAARGGVHEDEDEPPTSPFPSLFDYALRAKARNVRPSTRAAPVVNYSVSNDSISGPQHEDFSTNTIEPDELPPPPPQRFPFAPIAVPKAAADGAQKDGRLDYLRDVDDAFLKNMISGWPAHTQEDPLRALSYGKKEALMATKTRVASVFSSAGGSPGFALDLLISGPVSAKGARFVVQQSPLMSEGSTTSQGTETGASSGGRAKTKKFPASTAILLPEYLSQDRTAPQLMMVLGDDGLRDVEVRIFLNGRNADRLMYASYKKQPSDLLPNAAPSEARTASATGDGTPERGPDGEGGPVVVGLTTPENEKVDLFRGLPPDLTFDREVLGASVSREAHAAAPAASTVTGLLSAAMEGAGASSESRPPYFSGLLPASTPWPTSPSPASPLSFLKGYGGAIADSVIDRTAALAQELVPQVADVSPSTSSMKLTPEVESSAKNPEASSAENDEEEYVFDKSIDFSFNFPASADVQAEGRNMLAAIAYALDRTVRAPQYDPAWIAAFREMLAAGAGAPGGAKILDQESGQETVVHEDEQAEHVTTMRDVDAAFSLAQIVMTHEEGPATRKDFMKDISKFRQKKTAWEPEGETEASASRRTLMKYYHDGNVAFLHTALGNCQRKLLEKLETPSKPKKQKAKKPASTTADVAPQRNTGTAAADVAMNSTSRSNVTDEAANARREGDLGRARTPTSPWSPSPPPSPSRARNPPRNADRRSADKKARRSPSTARIPALPTFAQLSHMVYLLSWTGVELESDAEKQRRIDYFFDFQEALQLVVPHMFRQVNSFQRLRQSQKSKSSKSTSSQSTGQQEDVDGGGRRAAEEEKVDVSLSFWNIAAQIADRIAQHSRGFFEVWRANGRKFDDSSGALMEKLIASLAIETGYIFRDLFNDPRCADSQMVGRGAPFEKPTADQTMGSGSHNVRRLQPGESADEVVFRAPYDREDVEEYGRAAAEARARKKREQESGAKTSNAPPSEQHTEHNLPEPRPQGGAAVCLTQHLSTVAMLRLSAGGSDHRWFSSPKVIWETMLFMVEMTHLYEVGVIATLSGTPGAGGGEGRGWVAHAKAHREGGGASTTSTGSSFTGSSSFTSGASQHHSDAGGEPGLGLQLNAQALFALETHFLSPMVLHDVSRLFADVPGVLVRPRAHKSGIADVSLCATFTYANGGGTMGRSAPAASWSSSFSGFQFGRGSPSTEKFCFQATETATVLQSWTVAEFYKTKAAAVERLLMHPDHEIHAGDPIRSNQQHPRPLTELEMKFVRFCNRHPCLWSDDHLMRTLQQVHEQNVASAPGGLLLQQEMQGGSLPAGTGTGLGYAWEPLSSSGAKALQSDETSTSSANPRTLADSSSALDLILSDHLRTVKVLALKLVNNAGGGSGSSSLASEVIYVLDTDVQVAATSIPVLDFMARKRFQDHVDTVNQLGPGGGRASLFGSAAADGNQGRGGGENHGANGAALVPQLEKNREMLIALREGLLERMTWEKSVRPVEAVAKIADSGSAAESTSTGAAPPRAPSLTPVTASHLVDLRVLQQVFRTSLSFTVRKEFVERIAAASLVFQKKVPEAVLRENSKKWSKIFRRRAELVDAFLARAGLKSTLEFLFTNGQDLGGVLGLPKNFEWPLWWCQAWAGNVLHL